MILVYGEDLGLIDDKIFELTKNKYQKMILEGDLDMLASNFNQMSLFENENTNSLPYVIYDFYKMLSDESNTDSENKIEVNKLISFIKTAQQNKTLTIFVVNTKNIKNTYSPYFELINIPKLNRLTKKQYIVNQIKKNKLILKDSEIEYLNEVLLSNSLIIKNEVRKLSLLDNKIDKNIIDELLIFDISKNTFDLIDHFFNKNYEKIINHIHYLQALKIDFNEVFAIMVNQVFTLKLYYLSFMQNKSFIKICNEFNIKSFQIEKWKKLILHLDIYQINRLLENLIKLNINYLSGKSNLSISLQFILLNGGEYGI